MEGEEVEEKEVEEEGPWRAGHERKRMTRWRLCGERTSTTAVAACPAGDGAGEQGAMKGDTEQRPSSAAAG